MSYEVLIRPEAEAEIGEAYRWYEQQQDGLGSDFIVSLEEGMAKIIEGPERYPVVHRNVRRLLIRRFPYGIFYTIDQNLVVILAVFHGHRDPTAWKMRN